MHQPAEYARVAIALGSNLGDRASHLRAALLRLATLPQTRLVSASSFHETEPVGPVAQGHFLNAAALLETALAPHALLDHLHAIESSRGRNRAAEVRWGPRPLDLDLLLYADRIIDEPGLNVPHPRLHQRRFVLAPLAEIAPEMIVPTIGATITELLDRL